MRGFAPAINKIKNHMNLKRLFFGESDGRTLPPLTPPYKRGDKERQFFIKAEVLQDKASKVEA